MGLDNDKLAAAIVALYALTSKGDDWTDTDEVLQQAAFQLWEKSDWDAERMAVYLWQHGLGEEFAMSFTDISRERFWAAVRTTLEVHP